MFGTLFGAYRDVRRRLGVELVPSAVPPVAPVDPVLGDRGLQPVRVRIEIQPQRTVAQFAAARRHPLVSVEEVAADCWPVPANSIRNGISLSFTFTVASHSPVHRLADRGCRQK